MYRAVTISVLALAAMALSMACGSQSASAQSPTVVAEKLYDQLDQSFSNRNLDQLLSLCDPSFTLIDANGKHKAFADFRKQLADVFNNDKYRNFDRKTTIKDVQMQAGRMVVYVGTETHFQYRDQKLGWEPAIDSMSTEATWQRKGGQWRLVLLHELRGQTRVDPQWAALKAKEYLKRAESDQHVAESVLRPCVNSYNGC